MATASNFILVTPDEFLAVDTGTEYKAELDDGVIRMMGGGSLEHARVQANVMVWLGIALRGSGCRPLGPDAAIQSAGYSIRYPDVVVDCASDKGREAELQAKTLADPRVIVEVMSPTTRDQDEGPKLHEYRRMPRLRTIIYIDPDGQTVRVLEQVGVGRWLDTGDVAGADARLASFGLTLPHAEIFARD